MEQQVSMEDLDIVPRPRNLLSTYRQARKSVTSRRRNNAEKGGKKNPFVGMEYNSREAYLIQERKWLQEDELYLMEKTEDLRHGTMMKKLAERSSSEQDLYDKRTFFGPHSLKVKAAKAAKGAKAANAEQPRAAGRRVPQPPPDAGRKAVATGAPEYRSAAFTMKKLQQELESSQKTLTAARNNSKGPRRSCRPRSGQTQQEKEPLKLDMEKLERLWQ